VQGYPIAALVLFFGLDEYYVVLGFLDHFRKLAVNCHFVAFQSGSCLYRQTRRFDHRGVNGLFDLVEKALGVLPGPAT